MMFNVYNVSHDVTEGSDMWVGRAQQHVRSNDTLQRTKRCKQFCNSHAYDKI